MIINVTELSPSQVYHTLVQAVIPRPVAWVLTEHDNQRLNLAPFSYFSAISNDPPLLMLSIGNHPDGTPKDTYYNICQRKTFVIHLTRADLAQQVTRTARNLPAGESELELVDLETVEFEGFALPRLKAAPIAFACELYQAQQIGNVPHNLVFGEIRQIWVDDKVLREERGRLLIDAARLQPLGRLGGNEYSTLGEILDIPRER